MAPPTLNPSVAHWLLEHASSSAVPPHLRRVLVTLSSAPSPPPHFVMRRKEKRGRLRSQQLCRTIGPPRGSATFAASVHVEQTDLVVMGRLYRCIALDGPNRDAVNRCVRLVRERFMEGTRRGGALSSVSTPRFASRLLHEAAAEAQHAKDSSRTVWDSSATVRRPRRTFGVMAGGRAVPRARGARREAAPRGGHPSTTPESILSRAEPAEILERRRVGGSLWARGAREPAPMFRELDMRRALGEVRALYSHN